MRYALILFLWAIFSTVHADSVSISTIKNEGKEQHYLIAGTFKDEQNARQLKNKLVALYPKQSIEINKQPNNLYVARIGPFSELTEANTLKEKMSAPHPESPIATSSVKEPKNQETKEAAPLNDRKEEHNNKKLWNLRNAEIRAVIDEVSRVTGKNFVIDPRVQGKISIVSTTPISNDGLYQVFLSVLNVAGYSALPSGSIVKIVPNMDAKTFASTDRERTGEAFMVEVVPVHYVPAEQLVPVLRPLMPQWSNVSAYAPSNMVILAGRASNISRLAEIIRQVDSSSGSDIDMVPLKYALAIDVANTLKDLIKTQPTPGGSSGYSQLVVAADNRTNSIIITGNKTDRIRVRMLLTKMDKFGDNALNNNTQVVYLHFLRAEDLVPILAGVAQANFTGTVGTTIGTITMPALDSTDPRSNIAPTGSGSGSSGSGGSTGSSFSTLSSSTPSPSASASATSNTAKAATQTEGLNKPNVQIIAEPNTNSVILNGPGTVIKTLKAVIQQLDIRPAQILIEAMVVQVNEDDIKDLGIEWGTDNQQTTTVGGILRPNVGEFRNGFAIINTATSITDFQANVKALVTSGKAHVLSTPSVVVLDNRQAKIQVGQQIGVPSTAYPGTSTAGTPGGPYTTFERVNVTLHLYVRPQITHGRGIQMQIDQGNNDIVDPNAENPVFNISSIVTAVHIQSGDIVVLGGLSKDTTSNADNRLPILGDIPGVGRLFQHNIHTLKKQVLMVFIKPRILKNEQDDLAATDSKYNGLREYQLDWLRSQEVYNPKDADMLLPPVETATLPTPFSRPPQQLASIK